MIMRSSQPGASSQFLLIDSPVGLLRLAATDKGLVAMDWVEAADVMTPNGQGAAAARILRQSARWLSSYFKEHSPPSPLPPFELTGTPFQKAVWRLLAALPARHLTSYGQIARALGNPGACRAVGQAVGANPVPIFIPCHRVLAANGRIGGYSSGLQRKRWLLAHEGLMLPESGLGRDGGITR